jgi:mannose-1-phosphate guanylyltransferase
MFKASVFLKEMQRHSCEILKNCEKIFQNKYCYENDIFMSFSKDLFSNCPSDSVDYAVMEKTDNAVCIQGDFGWSDVGSFGSLARY